MSLPVLYQAQNSEADLVYQIADKFYDAQTLEPRTDLSMGQLNSNYLELAPAFSNLLSYPILVVSQNGYGLFCSSNSKLLLIFDQFPTNLDVITSVYPLLLPDLKKTANYQKIHPADLQVPQFATIFFNKCVRLSDSAGTVAQLLQV